MNTEQHERLYAILRGPEHSAYRVVNECFDDVALEQMDQLKPILQDIEEQAAARERFRCELEFNWLLQQRGVYAEAITR